MSRYISSVKPKKNGKTTKVKMAFGQIRPNDIENNGKKLGAPDTRKRVLFTGYPGGDAYNKKEIDGQFLLSALTIILSGLKSSTGYWY